MKNMLFIYASAVLLASCATNDNGQTAAWITQITVMELLRENPDEKGVAIAFLESVGDSAPLETQAAGFEKAFPGHGGTVALLVEYTGTYARPEWKLAARQLAERIRASQGK